VPRWANTRAHPSPEYDKLAAAAARRTSDDHSRPRAAWEISPERQEGHVPSAQGTSSSTGRARLHSEDGQGDPHHTMRIARPPKGRGHPRARRLSDRGADIVWSIRKRSRSEGGSAAQAYIARRVRERGDWNPSCARRRSRKPGQLRPGDELPGQGPCQARIAQDNGNLDHGALFSPTLAQGVTLWTSLEIYHSMPFTRRWARHSLSVSVDYARLLDFRHVEGAPRDARVTAAKLQPVVIQASGQKQKNKALADPRGARLHWPWTVPADRGRQWNGHDEGGGFV